LQNKAIYLNDLPGIFSTRGVLLVSQAGAQYTFRLVQDSRILAPRALTVLSVSSAHVIVQFDLDGGKVTLPLGEKVRLNVAYDSRLDMWVMASQVNADGTVVLRVGMYEQHSVQDMVHENGLFIVLTGVVAAGMTVGAHLYHRRRIPTLSKHWQPHYYAM
jgi:hypothetical protein